MAEEAKTTETKRTPDITQSELQVAFEFKLENYYQQGNDADKKVAEGILIDELRSFVANAGSEKTLTEALARARETVAGKNEISEARFNLISERIQGIYKQMAADAREESRKKMHDSMRDYSDLLGDETVRRARNPEDQKRKEDMEKAAADALRDFMKRGGDEKAVRETLADIPGVTPHFERRFTALAKMQAAFANYGETLREHGPSTKKESMAAKKEAEEALIKSLRSFAKAGGSTERMDEVLKDIYAEYGTKLEGKGSMTDYFMDKIRRLYAQEVAKEEERKKQQQQQSVDDKTQDDKTQDDKTQDDKTQDDKTQDDKTQDDKTQDDKTQDDKTQDDKTQDDKTQDDKTPEPVLDVGMEEDGSGHTKTQEGTEGIDWAKAFDLAKTYADEEKKNAFPKPTKIVANSYDNSGAELESGARISVNPQNPNSVTLHTTRDQANRPGAYLEDCMTFMRASAEKGYKSINIRNGNEAFVKAMYQAAIMQDFDPAKVNLPEEYKHMAQEWALEANEMKGGKIPESYKRDGQKQTGDEKTGVDQPAPAPRTSGEKTSGTKTSEPEKAGKKVDEHAARVTKKEARTFTDEEKEKINGFLRQLDTMAIDHVEGGKKGFSVLDKAKIKALWKETGIKDATVSDVLSARDSELKAHEDAMEAKAPGTNKAREALLGAVLPREIHEVTRGQEHKVAETLSLTDAQKKEVTGLLKDMEKAFGKSYGEAAGSADAKEKYEANVERFAAKIQKMAASFDVTPEALTTAIQQDSAKYSQVLSSKEKGEGMGISRGDFMKRAFETTFAKAPTARTGALYQAKVAVGKKVESMQIDHAYHKAQRKEKHSQKKQTREGSAMLRSVIERTKAGKGK